ncbi:MAG: glycosyltransferase family 4 protein [Planctomycetaceae bacterium]
MRIALACPYAWDDPGGVQVHVRELGGRLRERGHEVLVVAPARRRAEEPWVVATGSPVDLRYNRSSAPIDPRPWSRGVVRGVLAAFSPDLLHVHEPLTPSTSMWATLEARAPVVATFHSGIDRSRLYDVAAPLLRRVAGRLAIRIAVSRRAEQVASRRIGGAFEVVPNGVDVGRFAIATPRDLGAGTKALFVGRLDERKGFPVAVAAFERLALERTDLRMIVVGDGPQRDAVGMLPSHLRERVTMLGALPNDELPAVAAACDLYLGPSVGGESFGVVLIEAMAAGLPVVASDVPGYDEVLRDGVDGLLVAPRDPAALASAAARVLDDPALAARFAAAGRERAASYDWEAVVDRLEALYRLAAGLR